ncbi:MAG TPA: selenite/tellurite reduction operon porin ExtI [Thiobacillaceae bacterium]|nr:selenite/tellurite reduction operon porin ExtI [Thiobacillaceae bacterium]
MKKSRIARIAARPLSRACAVGLLAGMVPLTAAAGPTIEFGEQGSLTFTYALQGWLQYRDFTSPTDDGSSTDAFLRRNRVTFSGQYNDYVGFYAQLEAGNDSKLGNDNRSVYYRDAYVTLDYRDDLRFIVGRFKNTFSRENLEACLEPLTMDRGEVIPYTPFGGSRDTGVAVWGNLLDARLQYRFMLSDGREGDVVAEDNPRMTARVHYSFWEPEFNYGYLGTYLGTQKVLTIGAGYDRQDGVAYGNYATRSDIKDYDAWTVDAFMEYPTASGVYTLSGAYFEYDTGGATNMAPDPALPVSADLEGYYIKAGYMLPNKVGPGRLQFFVRHESSDYGRKTGNVEYYDNDWNSIGAHYYLDGQKLKVSFEYADISYDNQHPTDPALQDYNQATLGLQFIF